MDTLLVNRLLRVSCVAGLTVFVLLVPASAQGPGTSGQVGTGVPNQTGIGMGGTMTDQLVYGTIGHDIAREENSAYQAFLKEQDPAKKIRLGNDFVHRYPKSVLAEPVDVGMMNTYRAERDWKNAYLWADNALALQPDDVDVLTTVGWTIPHVYSPQDPDADQELDKAEKYSKHALEVLAKIPRPAKMSEQDFVAARAKRSFQAHSSLGLVYFRRDDYENSAKELEQATSGNPVQDQTDLFVLGVDLQNLKRYGEAEASFTKCAQITGPLQDQCKQNASSVRALANVSSAK
jgi:tetratricopeptide (TPR) repeat protein